MHAADAMVKKGCGGGTVYRSGVVRYLEWNIKFDVGIVLAGRDVEH